MAAAIEIAAYLVVAVALTAFGLFVEFHSYLQYTAGEPAAALWLAGFGALVLYAGIYLVGYDKVVRELTA